MLTMVEAFPYEHFLIRVAYPQWYQKKLPTNGNLNGEIDYLCIICIEPNYRRVQVIIAGVGQKKKFTINNVRIVAIYSYAENNTENYHELWALMGNKYIPDVPISRPEILIGLQYGKIGLMYEIREGKWHEPIGSRTVWVVNS